MPFDPSTARPFLGAADAAGPGNDYVPPYPARQRAPLPTPPMKAGKTMSFDPMTARPVDSRFDPTTARGFAPTPTQSAPGAPMPWHDVQLPNGKVLTVEAPDANTAMQAAQHYWAKNSDTRGQQQYNKALADAQAYETKQGGGGGWQNAVQSAMLGFGDELAGIGAANQVRLQNLGTYFGGKAPAYTPDQAYRAERQVYNENLAKYQGAHPNQALATSVGGGFLTPGTGALTDWAGAAPTLLGKVWRGALVGGAQGAAYGAGEAPDNHRTAGAVKGGAIGTAIGAAAPPLLVAAGVVARPMVGAVRRLGARAPQEQAAQMVADDMAGSATTARTNVPDAQPASTPRPSAPQPLPANIPMKPSQGLPPGIPMKPSAGLPANIPMKPSAAIPTLDTLGAAKTAAYKQADAVGAVYGPYAVQDMAQGLSDAAHGAGIDPDLNPKAYKILNRIEGMAGKPATFQDMENTRKLINLNLSTSADHSDRFFGNMFKDHLDNFVDNAGPEHMVDGDPVVQAQAIQTARAANVAFKKVEAIQNALQGADLRAASTGAGGNIDNATRQALRQLLQNKKMFWTPDEADALDKAVRGGTIQNLLRLVGKMGPEGNGLMMTAHAIGAIGTHGASIPLMAVGAAAKRGAEAMTDANVNSVLRAVTSKAPMAQAATPAAAAVPPAPFATGPANLGSFPVPANAILRAAALPPRKKARTVAEDPYEQH